MNQKLGIFGILGGLVYAVAGARMLLLNYGDDQFTDALGVAWAACWILGGWALLRLHVTGTSRLSRTVSFLLIAGFTTALVWGSYRLVDPSAADHSIVAVAPLLVIVGMLATGLLTLRANVLISWERALPLTIATIYVVTV